MSLNDSMIQVIEPHLHVTLGTITAQEQNKKEIVNKVKSKYSKSSDWNVITFIAEAFKVI